MMPRNILEETRPRRALRLVTSCDSVASPRDVALWRLTMQDAQAIEFVTNEGWISGLVSSPPVGVSATPTSSLLLRPLEWCIHSLTHNVPHPAAEKLGALTRSLLLSLAGIFPQNSVSFVVALASVGDRKTKPQVGLERCSYSQMMLRWGALASRGDQLRSEIASTLIGLMVGPVEVCSHLASVACAIELLHEIATSSTAMKITSAALHSIAADVAALLGTGNAATWVSACSWRLEAPGGEKSGEPLEAFLLNASRWMTRRWVAYCMRAASEAFATAIFQETVYCLGGATKDDGFSSFVRFLKLTALDPLDPDDDPDGKGGGAASDSDNLGGRGRGEEEDPCFLDEMGGLCRTGVSPVWDAWIQQVGEPDIETLVSAVDDRLPWYRRVTSGDARRIGPEQRRGRRMGDEESKSSVADCPSSSSYLMTAVSFLRRFRLIDDFRGEEEPEDGASLRGMFLVRALHPINAVRILCSRAGLLCTATDTTTLPSSERAAVPRTTGMVPMNAHVSVCTSSGLVRIHSTEGQLALEQLLWKAQEAYALPMLQACLRARVAALRFVLPLRRRSAALAAKTVQAFAQARLSQKLRRQRWLSQQRHEEQRQLLLRDQPRSEDDPTPWRTMSSPAAVQPRGHVMGPSVPGSEGAPGWMDHVERFEARYRHMLQNEQALQFETLIEKPCSRLFPTVQVRRDERAHRMVILRGEVTEFLECLRMGEQYKRQVIARNEMRERRDLSGLQHASFLVQIVQVWEPSQRRQLHFQQESEWTGLLESGPVANQLDALRLFATVARQQLSDSVTSGSWRPSSSSSLSSSALHVESTSSEQTSC
jgi:hypothetical protein